MSEFDEPDIQYLLGLPPEQLTKTEISRVIEYSKESFRKGKFGEGQRALKIATDSVNFRIRRLSQNIHAYIAQRKDKG